MISILINNKILMVIKKMILFLLTKHKKIKINQNKVKKKV